MSRILVVDDEPTVRELECAVLASAGHDAVGVSSGDEAVLLLDGESFDLVVTDVVMPGLDGFGLLAHVVGHHPGLPVLLVTGAVNRAHQLASAEGAAGVLYKPFTHTELHDAVARALAG
jgi:two-component system response regulator FlrC